MELVLRHLPCVNLRDHWDTMPHRGTSGGVENDPFLDFGRFPLAILALDIFPKVRVRRAEPVYRDTQNAKALLRMWAVCPLG
jgi:hypothetical protein